MECARRIVLGLILTFACSGGRSAIAIDASTTTIICGACHVPPSAGTPIIPSLVGASRDEIRTALLAYKTGAKTGVIMPRLARAWTDAEIDQIAAHVAQADTGR